MRPMILLGFLSAILVPHLPVGAVEDPDWAMAEVSRGARTMSEVFQRRLAYPMTYRFARGALEKNVHEKRDTTAFRVGAHLALVHWLSNLPQDLDWRPKALAHHRDLSQWMVRDAPVAPDRIAATVATALGLEAEDRRWLLEVLHGTAAVITPPTAGLSR